MENSPRLLGLFFCVAYVREVRSVYCANKPMSIDQEQTRRTREKIARRWVTQRLREYYHWLLSQCERDAEAFIEKVRRTKAAHQRVRE
jgi:hypothetical protein